MVASRLGSLAEIVHDGETGILFEPEDADGLARPALPGRRPRGGPPARRAGPPRVRAQPDAARDGGAAAGDLRAGPRRAAGRGPGPGGSARMSVALQRRPGGAPSRRGPSPPTSPDSRAGASRRSSSSRRSTSIRGTADPGVRFAIRNGTITNYGPSWWDQQKFGQFTPGDLAVIGFAYIGVIARLSSRRMQLHTRTAWLIGLGVVAVTIGVAVGLLNSTPARSATGATWRSACSSPSGSGRRSSRRNATASGSRRSSSQSWRSTASTSS